MLSGLVCLGHAILHSSVGARRLRAALIVPARRVGFQVLDHGGCQITVAGDVVALDDLTSLRVLIVAGPHQGVVAKVAADVGGDNFSVDAIARDKILVLAGGRRRHGSALVAGLSRHDDRFARG